MMISAYVFKTKALRALKGNWQTALLVSFFAALPMTLVQLLQATRLPDVSALTSYEAMAAAAMAIPQSTWLLLGGVGVLALLISPVLAIGCNFYFLRRLAGEELGFPGLFSRMGSFSKALGLYWLIYIKTFLWSLLLFVPGVIAALRYSMAPFYLAQNPELSVLEALHKSKQAMKTHKMSFFMLQLSFVVWLLGAMLSEVVLSGVSIILALVASQFIQLVMAAYLNATCASFYLAVSVPGGMEKAQMQAAQWLQNLGANRGYPGAFRRNFGNDDNDMPSDDPGAESTHETADSDDALDAESESSQDTPLGEGEGSRSRVPKQTTPPAEPENTTPPGEEHTQG